MTFEENLKTIDRVRELAEQQKPIPQIIAALVSENFSLSAIINAAAVELDTFLFKMDGKLVVTNLRIDSDLVRRYDSDVTRVSESVADTQATDAEIQVLLRGMGVMQELLALTDVTVIPLQQ